MAYWFLVLFLEGQLHPRVRPFVSEATCIAALRNAVGELEVVDGFCQRQVVRLRSFGPDITLQ
jgi:hypothetical protein